MERLQAWRRERSQSGTIGQAIDGSAVDQRAISDQRERALIMLQQSQNEQKSVKLLQHEGDFLMQLNDYARSDDVKTQRAVAGTFRNLCSQVHLQINLIESEVLPSLLFLAEQPDSKTRKLVQASMEALGVYSQQRLYDLYRSCGIDLVRYLCTCQDIQVQRVAASVLQTVLEDDTYSMTEADFRTVLYLATSSDKELQTYCGFAVLNAVDFLTDHPGVVAAVVAEGQVVPALVSLVLESVSQPGSCSPPIKLLAAHVITGAITKESFGCRYCSLEPIPGMAWRLSEQHQRAEDNSSRQQQQEEEELVLRAPSIVDVVAEGEEEREQEDAAEAAGGVVGAGQPTLPPGWMCKASRTRQKVRLEFLCR